MRYWGWDVGVWVCGADGVGARAYVGQRCQARVYVGLSGIEDEVGVRGVSSCAGVRW